MNKWTLLLTPPKVNKTNGQYEGNYNMKSSTWEKDGIPENVSTPTMASGDTLVILFELDPAQLPNEAYTITLTINATTEGVAFPIEGLVPDGLNGTWDNDSRLVQWPETSYTLVSTDGDTCTFDLNVRCVSQPDSSINVDLNFSDDPSMIVNPSNF